MRSDSETRETVRAAPGRGGRGVLSTSRASGSGAGRAAKTHFSADARGPGGAAVRLVSSRRPASSAPLVQGRWMSANSTLPNPPPASWTSPPRTPQGHRPAEAGERRPRGSSTGACGGERRCCPRRAGDPRPNLRKLAVGRRPPRGLGGGAHLPAALQGRAAPHGGRGSQEPPQPEAPRVPSRTPSSCSLPGTSPASSSKPRPCLGHAPPFT